MQFHHRLIRSIQFTDRGMMLILMFRPMAHLAMALLALHPTGFSFTIFAEYPCIHATIRSTQGKLFYMKQATTLKCISPRKENAIPGTEVTQFKGYKMQQEQLL